MAQLKTTKVFGDLNVTGEVNASTKITVNGEEVHHTGNMPTTATRWPTFNEVTGKPTNYTTTWGSVASKPAQATRWPTFAEVTSKPATYAPSSHTHPASQVTGLSDAATTTVETIRAGNAASATKLATARTIGGVSFDGSANINLPGVNAAGNQSTSGKAASATKLATARTINGVSFNGTANITVADSTKLPLAGGTVTGTTIFSGTTASTSATTGSLQCRGGIGVSGDIYAGGNVTAYSDIRLKKDIVNIPDALAKVIQLNGVTYTRKDSGERHTGLIAQEVQKVLPEAVSGGEYLGVAYGNMVGLLIEAIKELKAEVDELKGVK